MTIQEGPAAVIRGLAAEQHGVVSRSQLLAAGVPRHVVAYRVRSRELRCLHRGVYLVGPLLVPRAREMAAALACGDAAAVSHGSAAWLGGLAPALTGDGAVDVLVAGGKRGIRPGIRMHRVFRLLPDEVTWISGIPVTTASRTLLDLAEELPARELEPILARAERERLVNLTQLQALVARHPRHRGAGLLRAMINPHAPAAVTRSALEAQFLSLVRKGGLPRPETNVRLYGFEVDFYWVAAGVVAELDGHAYHTSRPAFESDRRRDRVLAAAGLRVLRVTWTALVEEPERVLVDLTRALERSPALRRPHA